MHTLTYKIRTQIAYPQVYMYYYNFKASFRKKHTAKLLYYCMGAVFLCPFDSLVGIKPSTASGNSEAVGTLQYITSEIDYYRISLLHQVIYKHFSQRNTPSQHAGTCDTCTVCCTAQNPGPSLDLRSTMGSTKFEVYLQYVRVKPTTHPSLDYCHEP